MMIRAVSSFNYSNHNEQFEDETSLGLHLPLAFSTISDDPEYFLFQVKSKSEFGKWEAALKKERSIVEEDAANGFLIPHYIR